MYKKLFISTILIVASYLFGGIIRAEIIEKKTILTPVIEFKSPEYDADCSLLLEKETVNGFAEFQEYTKCAKKAIDFMNKNGFVAEYSGDKINGKTFSRQYKQASYNIGVMQAKDKKLILNKTIDFVDSEIKKYEK